MSIERVFYDHCDLLKSIAFYRLLFWGDLQGHIERSNLDGSGRIVLYKKEGSKPRSLSFCEKTRTLYWIDGNAGTLNRMS